jgi:hypothetical protein
MSGGRDLLGQPEPERRKPGRPKGSTGKKAKDLKGYIEARFGGSAAQQMAAACMVTPAEVRRAGSVLAARVAKAQELKDALGGTTTLKEAWDLLSKELAALAPYTDQRQPLAIEQVGDGFRPAVVFMGAAPVGGQGAPTDIAGEFRVIAPEVSSPKSHEGDQALDLPGLLPPDASPR